MTRPPGATPAASGSVPLSPADTRQLDAWVEALGASGGELPPGVAPVQTRLVRAVGRGVLPDAGPVFVKAMAFPRAKDRLRYVHRALPGVHEARMLAAARAAGVACPAVVLAVGRRRLGLPDLSVLVTSEMEGESCGDVAPRESAPLARVAAALAAAGLFHPDLNRGNFLRLEGGRVAVLDLQSARLRNGSLPRPDRLRMASKFALEFGLDGEPDGLDILAEAGLVTAEDLPTVRAHAGHQRRVDLCRRIRRCMMTSTEFVAERRLLGARHRRREADLSRSARHSHPDAKALWIGDRALEVLDGRPPILAGFVHKSCWLRAERWVYSARGDGISFSETDLRRLLDGHQRFRDLERGRGAAPSRQGDFD